MERHYYKRGERIAVEEIDGVAAIQVDPAAVKTASGGDAPSYGRSGVTALRNASEDVPDETIEAFGQAGWVFVQPNSESRNAISRRELPARAADAGRVVQRRGGRLAVVTRAMTVQLDAGLDDAAARAALDDLGLEMVRALTFAPNLFQVIATRWDDALAASVDLHDDDRVVFAEPEFIEHIPPRGLAMQEARALPSDPDLDQQWQWRNDGSNGGTAGADVNAEEAWDHSWGAGITVAVIDNGFDADHEDLAAGVVPESGYFDGSANWVQGTAGMPSGNHGTFCAGMVGARRDNGLGGVGAAPDCDLMLIAALGDTVGSQATLARGVAYAIDMSNEVPGADLADGPDILVCSLGPNGAVWDLETVLELALDAAPTGRQGLGLPIFWAASNGNNVDVAQDRVVSHPNVIAVVRSDRTDTEDNAARGEEVELIAPGVDVYSCREGDAYGTSTGTSFAAPCAAGCAALALSVNPTMTGAELRQIMRDSADQIGPGPYDAAGHNDDYGFGRVNAGRAVRDAARRVDLLTSSLVFNDVPEGELAARAIAWQGFGFDDLTFETVSGPAAPFAHLSGTSTTLPAPGVRAGATAQLWFTYTGTSAGASDSGSVTVRCVETGEEWVVPISANTIARPNVAVCLVLDQSGSMDGNAGDGRTRNAVLREAAQTFVEVAYPDTGLGIVRFDHDAHPVMAIADAGPEIFGPGRVQATGLISAHTPNPGGLTSIGDGVESAANDLSAVAANYDETAMIVLTDGQENSPKLIADVAGSIGDKVFAIGLGEPSVIDPAKLSQLTDATGGWVSMTGDISSDEYFTLTKYYLQILAGVTNQEIVLDPDGHLKPTGTVEIPFDLNAGDTAADVILMSPAPEIFDATLVTPSGAEIPRVAPPPGARWVSGRNVGYFRLTLPVVADGKAAGSGRWRLRLHADRARFRQWLDSLEGKDPKAYQYAARHGLRYAVEVHARSSIRMQSELVQKGTGLGDVMQLTAQLSEAGLPLSGRAEVVAEMTGPMGTATLKLEETRPGQYALTLPGRARGLYRFRLIARGDTLRGERFTRERWLSGSIYVARPPQQEGEPEKPTDRPEEPDAGPRPCPDVLAALHKAISSDPECAKRLARILERRGIRLDRAMACLKAAAKGGGTVKRPTLERPDLFQPTVKWADVLAAMQPGATATATPQALLAANVLRTIE